MDKRLLPKEDEEVSTSIEQIMRAEGLNILLNHRAVRVTTANGQKVLTVEQDGKETVLHAEEILVAARRRPNIEGLDLQAASVKYDKQRVVTDEYLRTSAHRICCCRGRDGPFSLHPHGRL
jgi:pyruvate/2-oxoglutarate dehydrogenase complex dihydrolipoamide dehydrogenase (E3) component